MPRLRLALAVLASVAGSPASAQDGLGEALLPAPPPPANVVDPIGAAFARLSYAEIEDDLSSGDARIKAMVTKDCTTEMRAADKSWALNWRTVTEVGPGDTFVYVAGPGVQLAIVGDASKPDQAAALSALHMAMRAMRERCRAKPRGDAGGS